MQTSLARLDPVFDALADPTRRSVLQSLGRGPRRSGELADELGIAPPAMSKHLRVLLEAGVVEAERVADDARVRVFHLRPQSMTAVRDWLDRLQAEWERNLGAFKAHVERKHQKEKSR